DLIRHQSAHDAAGMAGVDASFPAGAPPATARDDTRSLLSLSSAEVIRLGLISNRGMIVVAAAFGAAWQILPERTIEQFFRQGAKQAFGYAEQLHLGWMASAAGV